MTSSFRVTLTAAIALAAIVAAALLTTTEAQAAGSVEVRWVQPERFSDIGYRPWDREHTLKVLGEYLQQLGQLIIRNLASHLQGKCL